MTFLGAQIFKSIWLSITSFQFYKDILRQPFYKTLQYFCVVALLASLCIGLRYTITLKTELNKLAQWTLSHIPDFSIRDGALNYADPQPLYVEEGNSAIIIDHFDTKTTLDKKYGMGVLVNRQKVYIRLDALKENHFQFSEINLAILGATFAAAIIQPDIVESGVLNTAQIKDFVFNEPNVHKWKKTFAVISMIFFPLFYFLYFLIAKLIQAAFFSMVIIISNKALKEIGVTYEHMFNVCVYAVTPVALLMVIIAFVGIVVPYIEFIYLFLYVAFLLGALSQIIPKPKKSEPEENTDDWM